MKRRDFLIGSAGALGAIGPRWALATTPCPMPSVSVTVNGDTNTVTTQCLPPDTSLEQACDSLSAGASADLPGAAQSFFSEADLSWQTCFHHDGQHGLIHLLGKPAGDNNAWKHQYYTISSGAWTLVSDSIFQGFPGHIYGVSTLDQSTGDLYLEHSGIGGEGGNARKMAHWDYATKTWGWVPNAGEWTGSILTTPNGLTFHPHLFGQDDGGTVMDTQTKLLYWRKSTDALFQTSHSTNLYGDKEGVGCYWPAKQWALVGGQSSGSLAKVTSNGTGTPTAELLPRPPIDLGGHSHLQSGKFGSLHVHPGNPDKLLIVETNGPRAWTSTDASNWVQIGNHPFSLMPRVVCPLQAALGCLWAVGLSGSTDLSRLWRPPT